MSVSMGRLLPTHLGGQQLFKWQACGQGVEEGPPHPHGGGTGNGCTPPPRDRSFRTWDLQGTPNLKRSWFGHGRTQGEWSCRGQEWRLLGHTPALYSV